MLSKGGIDPWVPAWPKLRLRYWCRDSCEVLPRWSRRSGASILEFHEDPRQRNKSVLVSSWISNDRNYLRCGPIGHRCISCGLNHICKCTVLVHYLREYPPRSAKVDLLGDGSSWSSGNLEHSAWDNNWCVEKLTVLWSKTYMAGSVSNVRELAVTYPAPLDAIVPGRDQLLATQESC